MNINNFWNNHTVNDFQLLALVKNVHSSKINSLCFLKDGRIVSSSIGNNILIFIKIHLKLKLELKKKKE